MNADVTKNTLAFLQRLKAEGGAAGSIIVLARGSRIAGTLNNALGLYRQPE